MTKIITEEGIEELKNTIVGILNVDPEFRLEMAEHCMNMIDVMSSELLQAREQIAELEEKLTLKSRACDLYDETIEELNRAVEHGGYLATTAEGFMKELNNVAIDGEGFGTSDALSDYWGALKSDIYEFRKRIPTPSPELLESET